eukprot:CAMPEP_0172303390 /NCGR_PEP_ID=MMETSP1058-20130122/4925_1 /TAXON_ID=83371 /ORGANISM="Detonula confervacea, Strain CCMP 353" /LENGTH=441 /DNA_ID=CAMNT_0013014175 /DNA_START=153 /DNA_END=1475 /DNA_ORIENTATION=-
MDSSTVLRISNAPYLPDIDLLAPTSTAIPSTNTTTKSGVSTNPPSYLIHKGRAVLMIKRCVAVEGLSLSKGWTPQATEAFKLAIEALVRTNPILTGKLVEVNKSPWPWSPRSELWITPNAFPPESHSFVTVVDPPSGMMSPGEIVQDGLVGEESTKDLFKYVHATLGGYLLSKASFSANQIEDGSPLFEAKLMDLGDGTAAYSIKMSHAIGDGTTFYQLVSQISSYMNGRTPSQIDWNNPLKATHEIYPENFSERDYHRSYGLPFGWGVFKNLRTLSKRKCRYLLLSKDKVARKKKDLQSMKTDGSAISANDIIMSSVCEMCGSSDVFAFDKSVRGIKEGVSKSAAGNFFWEIPFEREHGKDPFEIRKILTSNAGSYFGTNEVPLLPFLNGRVGRITSLASIAHQTNFPGSQVICSFPSASFIKDLPLDVAVIFRFDKDHW